MIKRLFAIVAIVFKSSSNIISDLSNFIARYCLQLVQQLRHFHYSINNLIKANTDLGIYHLKKGNLSDAIFRFKLIDKFLDPGNKISNYWLGWIYFLKNNDKQAILHLRQSGSENEPHLLSFVQNINNIQTIPDDIIALHRTLMYEQFLDSFSSTTIDLPKILITKLNQSINYLPDEYKILELGSNVGVLGNEVNLRMQENFDFTGVEPSAQMINLQSTLFPEFVIYDKIINSSVADFLENNSFKYDVILSLDGISYSSDLENTLALIYSSLNKGGYFAFCLQKSQSSYLSRRALQFIYNCDEVNTLITKLGYQNLLAEELTMDNKRDYSIFFLLK